MISSILNVMADDLKDLTDLDDNRLYAAMSYLLVLVLVPLLTRKNDSFVNFHARQGLIMLLAIILALVINAWNGAVGSVFFVVLMLLDVVALVMALQGRKWKIPFIGNLAEKIRI